MLVPIMETKVQVPDLPHPLSLVQTSYFMELSNVVFFLFNI